MHVKARKMMTLKLSILTRFYEGFATAFGAPIGGVLFSLEEVNRVGKDAHNHIDPNKDKLPCDCYCCWLIKLWYDAVVWCCGLSLLPTSLLHYSAAVSATTILSLVSSFFLSSLSPSQASSFWSTKLMWRATISTAVACFTLGLLKCLAVHAHSGCHSWSLYVHWGLCVIRYTTSYWFCHPGVALMSMKPVEIS